MEYTLNIKKYDGVEQYKYSTEQLVPLEEKCLVSFDWRIADLINLFLEREFCNSGENGINNRNVLAFG